jgi:hypothetical protein
MVVWRARERERGHRAAVVLHGASRPKKSKEGGVSQTKARKLREHIPVDPTSLAIWVHLASHCKVRNSERLCRLRALVEQLRRDFLDFRIARSLFCLRGKNAGAPALPQTETRQANSEHTANAGTMVARA